MAFPAPTSNPERNLTHKTYPPESHHTGPVNDGNPNLATPPRLRKCRKNVQSEVAGAIISNKSNETLLFFNKCTRCTFFWFLPGWVEVPCVESCVVLRGGRCGLVRSTERLLVWPSLAPTSNPERNLTFGRQSRGLFVIRRWACPILVVPSAP